MGEPVKGEESIVIAATPEKVWDLVADVPRMGEWSPETQRAAWVGGATGPAGGAKFKGSNRSGFARWSTTVEVVAAERGKEFAFFRPPPPDGGCTWRYTFEAVDGGTRVTESWEAKKEPGPIWRVVTRLFVGPDRDEALRKGVRTTLERLKAAAEANEH